MKRLIVLCYLMLSLTVTAQDYGDLATPPLQILWTSSDYYVLSNDPINMITVVLNTTDEPMQNLVMTIDAPTDGVRLRFDDLFTSNAVIEELDAGETRTLIWGFQAANEGIYELTADIEVGDTFYTSTTRVHVGQRSPSLAYVERGIFTFIAGLGSGQTVTQMIYGQPNSDAIAGDWDGDGFTGVGVYEDATFFLRNRTAEDSNGLVTPDYILDFPPDLEDGFPLAGDFGGRGVDTVAVYLDGFFYIRYFLESAIPDVIVEFGEKDNPNVIPLAGDWDGDGVDTIGVYVNGTFFLKNDNRAGDADIVFDYGNRGNATPIVGDWNGDGIDSVAVISENQLFLRDELGAGSADATIPLNPDLFLPQILIGYWRGADN